MRAQSADLLLLDEPTSHLDAHAQNYVLETIDKACRDPRTGQKTKTVIVITHQLSLARRADKIAMFENGVSDFRVYRWLLCNCWYVIDNHRVWYSRRTHEPLRITLRFIVPGDSLKYTIQPHQFTQSSTRQSYYFPLQHDSLLYQSTPSFNSCVFSLASVHSNYFIYLITFPIKSVVNYFHTLDQFRWKIYEYIRLKYNFSPQFQ